MKKLMQGFTMIELLVVIAIIGVLAAAVLSAINPVEQINKGRDTRFRSDSAELNNAIERYFAVQEFFPWNGACAGGGSCTYDCLGPPDICGAENSNLAMTFDGPGGDGVAGSWIWLLDETDEVKPNFVERLTNDEELLYMHKELDAGVTYVCFLPSSRAFRSEAQLRCANDPTTLPGSGAPLASPFVDICPDPTDIDADNMICVP